ncbi:hypothetical protein Q6A77_01635 [Aliarcobacter skirrowii]|uniref:hypothetical protein n=1 Tax=Aliarcobacter skirrowii TaxID=28200 RepID=UPI0029A52605|nr:hypothetical protein [Aliarcobacter skirrowii]MDX4057366.1 hypothetical protein [Aliarcobacter skirrowii]
MQLTEILNHSNKIKTVDDLLNHFDLVVEIAKNDINKIAKSKRIFFTDFDFTYSDSVEILRSQLKKSHLKSVSKFLQCENIENAVAWLVQRLLNNMKNISTNAKYKLYCAPSFGQLHENIKSNDELENMLELMELEKFDRNTIKKGLQTIWDNSMLEEDFDYLDIEYLCKKFDLSIKDVFGTDDLVKLNLKKEQTESGHSQLVFVF